MRWAIDGNCPVSPLVVKETGAGQRLVAGGIMRRGIDMHHPGSRPGFSGDEKECR